SESGSKSAKDNGFISEALRGFFETGGFKGKNATMNPHLKVVKTGKGESRAEIHVGKSEAGRNVEFNTRDNSDTANVVSALTALKGKGEMRTSGRRSRSVTYETVEHISVSSEMTAKATISELFARSKLSGEHLLAGGSGSLRVADKIAEVIYGAKASSVTEGRLSKTAGKEGGYEYKVVDSLKLKSQLEGREGKELTLEEYTAEWMLRCETGELRSGSYVRGGDPVKIIREYIKLKARTLDKASLREIEKILEGIKESDYNSYSRKSLRTRESIENGIKDGFLDVLMSRLKNSGLKTETLEKLGLDRIEVLDKFTNEGVVEAEAGKTGVKYEADKAITDAKRIETAKKALDAAVKKGDRTAIEKAQNELKLAENRGKIVLDPDGIGSRGMDYKNLSRELILNAEKLEMGDLVQTAARVNRGNDAKIADRVFGKEAREFIVDMKNMKKNYQDLSEMVKWVKENRADHPQLKTLEKLGDFKSDKMEGANGTLERNAEFQTAMKRSASAQFKSSTEIRQMLADAPLGEMLARMRTEGNKNILEILEKYEKKLRETEEGGKDPNYSNEFRDTGLSQFKSAQETARRMWKEISSDKKLSNEIREEAKLRYDDISRVKVDRVEANDRMSFAQIDTGRVFIARDVASVVKSISKNYLPDRGNPSSVSPTVKITEARVSVREGTAKKAVVDELAKRFESIGASSKQAQAKAETFFNALPRGIMTNGKVNKSGERFFEMLNMSTNKEVNEEVLNILPVNLSLTDKISSTDKEHLKTIIKLPENRDLINKLPAYLGAPISSKIEAFDETGGGNLLDWIETLISDTGEEILTSELKGIIKEVSEEVKEQIIELSAARKEAEKAYYRHAPASVVKDVLTEITGVPADEITPEALADMKISETELKEKLAVLIEQLGIDVIPGDIDAEVDAIIKALPEEIIDSGFKIPLIGKQITPDRINGKSADFFGALDRVIEAGADELSVIPAVKEAGTVMKEDELLATPLPQQVPHEEKPVTTVIDNLTAGERALTVEGLKDTILTIADSAGLDVKTYEKQFEEYSKKNEGKELVAHEKAMPANAVELSEDIQVLVKAYMEQPIAGMQNMKMS
ncbi:hypothetical protein ACFLR5_02155, partial [Elusimicrobiota bacterium]